MTRESRKIILLDFTSTNCTGGLLTKPVVQITGTKHSLYEHLLHQRDRIPVRNVSNWLEFGTTDGPFERKGTNVYLSGDVVDGLFLRGPLRNYARINMLVVAQGARIDDLIEKLNAFEIEGSSPFDYGQGGCRVEFGIQKERTVGKHYGLFEVNVAKPNNAAAVPISLCLVKPHVFSRYLGRVMRYDGCSLPI